MALEHQEQVVPQEAVQRIKAEMHQAEQELSAGHQKEAQEILWKALSEASILQDSKMATKILELLSGNSPQH